MRSAILIVSALFSLATAAAIEQSATGAEPLQFANLPAKAGIRHVRRIFAATECVAEQGGRLSAAWVAVSSRALDTRLTGE
ncbi:hypothetical protein V491_07925 [Pseudogymnoascus sp. VKM F-3775]|nr:hypothetical protein V491_07925 [Pseudogymnoascus sp. VKM F-3775]